VRSTDKPHVDVAIALCWRGGRLLVTRRPPGVHLALRWEFPGGKLGTGETPEACAVRELFEEVGVVARARGRRPLIVWEYAERSVTLHPIDCDWQDGDGVLHEVLELRWVPPSELAALDFPEANAGLVAALVGEGAKS
jgi:8-oxo-dGTP diphosphatase